MTPKTLFFVLYEYQKCQKNAFQNFINFVLALLRNTYVQVKFSSTASYADDTESIGIKTTGIASLVCVLLISATFRTGLDHRVSPRFATQTKGLGQMYITSLDNPIHSGFPLCHDY